MVKGISSFTTTAYAKTGTSRFHCTLYIQSYVETEVVLSCHLGNTMKPSHNNEKFAVKQMVCTHDSHHHKGINLIIVMLKGNLDVSNIWSVCKTGVFPRLVHPPHSILHHACDVLKLRAWDYILPTQASCWHRSLLAGPCSVR